MIRGIVDNGEVSDLEECGSSQGCGVWGCVGDHMCVECRGMELFRSDEVQALDLCDPFHTEFIFA